jgi:predicted nucleic acid-binding Zn ribbon protein
MVLEGWDRTQAAEFNGMNRQTLRHWVHRYNKGGVEGLKSRRSPGRPPVATEQRFGQDGCIGSTSSGSNCEYGRSATPTVNNAIHTCPMHAQVRQAGPGHCPVCGMALEPVRATASVEGGQELVDMTRRFRVAAALTAPVFALEMGGHVPALGLDRFVWPSVSSS